MVEDSPGDVRLMREGLQQWSIPYRLTVLVSGSEAMQFLFKQGAYAEAWNPDLIVLDWNLPKVDGSSVLQAIKANPQLSRIPVIVFSTSSSTADVNRAYELHAQSFFTKPMEIEPFFQTVADFENLWKALASGGSETSH